MPRMGGTLHRSLSLFRATMSHTDTPKLGLLRNGCDAADGRHSLPFASPFRATVSHADTRKLGLLLNGCDAADGRHSSKQ
eukprot:358526-Chlamydomonas_euryale.AAC.5